MGKIKNKEYIRTDKGYIAKIKEFIPHYTEGRRLGKVEKVKENYLLIGAKQCEIIESIDYSIPPCYPSDEELEKIKKHIVKHSPNIIDLIEVGDYINGQLIEKIYKKEEDKIYYEFLENKDGSYEVMEMCELKNIKSIVTKEQYSQIEYRLEEK